MIECKDLYKVYRKGDSEIVPLAGVDLAIEAGEFLALTGPSGSGKSTLLNLIAGIDRPTRGQLLVQGEPIGSWSDNRLAKWRTRMIGYVFQQFNLMPLLTAYENVELPLRLLPLSRAQRERQVMTALELVGLVDRKDHRPSQLSGGQEQRVAIARAVVTDPAIILADEPTGNLDRESARRIMDLLVELHAGLGKTIVMVTHDDLVAARAQRVIAIDKGHITAVNAGEGRA
jgi:putative ABC transport system ATP-binding protein